MFSKANSTFKLTSSEIFSILHLNNKEMGIGTMKDRSILAEDIGVDAGIIMVADLSYLDDVPKRDDPSKLGKVFKVKNGIYEVGWFIRNTWNGSVSGRSRLHVKSGKIFVCDPCYVIGDGVDDNDPENLWGAWLDNTDYAKDIRSMKAFIIDEMGGDGCYDVNLNMEFIKEFAKVEA